MMLIVAALISNAEPSPKNTPFTMQQILKKVEEIKTYHVVLNTKIFPLMLNQDQIEKQKNQDNRQHTINTSTVFGESYKKLRINSQLNMAEFKTKVDLLMIFDGTWQWVEKRISKYEDDRIVAQNISAMKINISATTKDPQNDPFNTAYGISGIGLFRYKDLPGTLKAILSRYDFENHAQEDKNMKNQELFIGKVKDYKNDLQPGADKREDKAKTEENLTKIEKKNTQICKIWVGKEDKLIHAYSLGANMDNSSIYSEIKYNSINQPLPKDIFSYTPPDGINVIDFTKQILQIRRKNEELKRDEFKKTVE